MATFKPSNQRSKCCGGQQFKAGPIVILVHTSAAQAVRALARPRGASKRPSFAIRAVLILLRSRGMMCPLQQAKCGVKQTVPMVTLGLR